VEDSEELAGGEFEELYAFYRGLYQKVRRRRRRQGAACGASLPTQGAQPTAPNLHQPRPRRCLRRWTRRMWRGSRRLGFSRCMPRMRRR
jgi:hypothetical protein